MAHDNEYKKSITKDGMTKSLCIKQVENGYVITISKYGNLADGDYIDESKTYISKTNPMEKENELPQQEEASLLDLIGEVQ
jgi:hypothetical protein